MDALTCSLAALLLATAVGPGHQLPVVVQDDALLLNRAPAQVQQYTDQIAAEGASDVRLTASWSGLAPSPTATKKPAAPFDASDSKTYPVDGFRRLDTAVKAAAASGLDVELDLAFWAPRWAVPKASDRNDRERYMPKPAEFGLFARALARRYSGTFPDPDQPGRMLPAVRLWVPWNEPNQPAFLSPQRDVCHVNAPAVSPDEYAALVRELRVTLDEAPGDQQLVLGETAAYDTPRPTAASTVEFVDGLPQDVVCASDIWAQHAYVGTEGIGPVADLAGDPGKAGSAQLLTALEHALDLRGCSREKRIWITETGVGGPKPGGPRPTSAAALRGQCRALNAALQAWYRAPRVDAAFQYTFREDNTYPVGLVNTGLTETYPTYDLLRAWSDRAFPTDRPPPLPTQC